MLSNELPLKSSNYPISPFKKVPNIPPQIPKYNYYNDTRQIFHPNTPQEKLIQTPVQFGVNVYFGHHKYFSPPVPLPDPYLQNNQENIPICILFKNSLAKSGYKLTPEQSVLYKDTYKKHSSINSFYDNFNFCPINNNNNIINNIYPTFTKVTNVQILSDNESAKVNEKEIDTKKENINSINKLNTNRQINLKNFGKLKREENAKISIIINDNNNTDNNKNNNSNKKVIFECSETNGGMNGINSKNLLKKKRLRKNNQQLGLLSKFYTENKNWTKKQIKEISESIGLKENKIYKWLWDQKNKEYKATKFVVNK